MSQELTVYAGSQGTRQLQELIGSAQPLAQLSNPQSEVMQLIGTTLSFQHTVNGYKAVEKLDENEESMVKAAILSVIMRYKFVSLEEVRYIFSQGLTGEFGKESVFFNARNVNFWMHEYTSKLRRQLMIEQRRQELAQETIPEPTEEERQKLSRGAWELFRSWVNKSLQALKEKAQERKVTPDDLEDPIAAPLWYKRLIEKELLQEPSLEDKLQAVEAMRIPAMERIRDRERVSRVLDANDPEVHDLAKILAQGLFIRRLLVSWFYEDRNPLKNIS